MKTLKILKWVVPVVLLIAIGSKLFNHATEQENQLLAGYQLHIAAAEALNAGDFNRAYTLYRQSVYAFEDPQLKAVALYEAATVGWAGSIADFHTLVGLYQQSLRFSPGLHEAAFNLEYLYWLKENNPEQLPQPADGQRPALEQEDEGQPGTRPSNGEEGTYGDI